MLQTVLTKVNQFDSSVGGDKNILSLYISVDDVVLVQKGQRLKKSKCHFCFRNLLVFFQFKRHKQTPSRSGSGLGFSEEGEGRFSKSNLVASTKK